MIQYKNKETQKTEGVRMNEKKPAVGILPLGCKVNQYESEAAAEELRRRGYTVLPPEERCDAYIINTCAVTAEAARKSRQMIRRLRSRSPGAFVIVTGCLAQTSPDELAAIAGVDAVIGNTKKLAAIDELDRLVARGRSAAAFSDVPAFGVNTFEPMAISAFSRTRVYVKIEDGCENRCSYCIIPDARGPVRSKQQDAALEEIAGLVRGGAREVVLTGIEVASYGRDLGDTSLEELLCAADALPEVRRYGVRIRLGSLEPSLLRPGFIEKISRLSSVAPHFHISLQSGCSRTLAAMRRKYNADRAMKVLDDLRAAIPGVQFTCDVIVGFPGETEEDFAETLDFMRRARFLAAHVFPYSPRRGTPAAVMPGQIPEPEKHRRAAVLSDLERGIRKEILDDAVNNSPMTSVLFETFDGATAVGHTGSFIEVRVPATENPHGRLLPVRLTGTAEDPSFEYGSVCLGKMIEEENR